ncbi:hypothetical protein LptCag_1310 [Leptospirillum ferriphilum]|jgi:cell division protein FtsX|uniref:Cell division protein FtsX n=2 Tax=Leptospirillum TaxID=179 RepID=A0A094W648_9BACT|nr:MULTISPECIES: hypothetical protein [Leptospirillum]EAY57164.1 MAG: hypothetical protein UBAL2_79310002 [Leptospirillum rubarum]EDZ38771.1 MAG: Hypothetical protein CGL2_10665011 [Leptospirillum sp. Group II '5-way CG']EIJ77164.1 MAG: Hypothetical protein C75L2_00680013 [Leptospirillum sp. Group II 'C75']AKS23721.1 hypothetical protein ABH19_08160 [Leptospirillum sp. Group II 'CF-1']KGA92933.1 hypothetical protein LptCag_1310 [Leptospirillum ferriphilum]
MSLLTRSAFLLFILVSSIPFAFFLWVSSLFFVTKIQTEKLYPAIHMIVVLKHATNNKDMNTLLDRISEITGEKSVRLISTQEIAGFLPALKDGESVRIPSRFQHILSVRISYGYNPQGQRTYLIPQINSLKDFLEKDPHVLMIELNEAWASRLDFLNRVMDKVKDVGLILLLLTIFAIFIYWIQIFRLKWSRKSLKEETAPSQGFSERKRMWDSTPILEEPESELLGEHPFPLLWGGAIAGFFSGLIALLSLMVLHPVLYPDGLDPFYNPGIHGKTVDLNWFLFPVMTGAFGWLSSVLSRI